MKPKFDMYIITYSASKSTPTQNYTVTKAAPSLQFTTTVVAQVSIVCSYASRQGPAKKNTELLISAPVRYRPNLLGAYMFD